ncbi:MAG: monovalent cation/H+ antiporter subunit D family protein [Betaproteobacteria bacterium]|nr:monovalent cation/H+ antiporter subunit D family protein [Betaproteobacteria bacterium]
MMTTIASLLLLCLLIPLVGAVLIGIAGRYPNLRETFTFMTAGLLLACVMALIDPIMKGDQPVVQLAELMPDLTLSLQPEPLGLLFALLASGLWVVNSLYSVAYVRANDEAHQTRFFVFFALSICATLGIAWSGNFLTLFLFYELLTLATWPLVTHHGDEAAKKSGRIYLGVLMGTSICLLLPALVAIYALTGTTDFALGGILEGHVAPSAALVLLALCMLGIGKAALVPFHAWLPNAMVAPTPVSALLHAVAVVKAGVFTVVKLMVYIFGTGFLAESGITGWLTALAGLTIVFASLVALNADNLKRRLAYSTISQLSYVTLSASLLSVVSVTGAVLHIAAHAVGKITLFFAAGAIYTAAHKTRVSELRGIGRRMPWTMGAFAVGALSMIGLPPTAGFVSKWYMLSGAMAEGQALAVIVIILSTLLNAAYFLPILYQAFFVAEDSQTPPHGEAPTGMLIALTTTALLTLAMFFLAEWPLALARLLH